MTPAIRYWGCWGGAQPTNQEFGASWAPVGLRREAVPVLPAIGYWLRGKPWKV